MGLTPPLEADLPRVDVLIVVWLIEWHVQQANVMSIHHTDYQLRAHFILSAYGRVFAL